MDSMLAPFTRNNVVSAQNLPTYAGVTGPYPTLKKPFRAIAFILLFATALARNAHANLVQNGNFTSVTYSGTAPLTTDFGQFGTETGSELTVTDWTTSGYNFVFTPSTVDEGTSTGANPGEPNQAPGQYNASNGYGSTYMWGSNNGGSVTLPATDPAGGNFIAADGAYETEAISQQVNGLTIGDMYLLKFYWAGAQQQSFTGTTTEAWQVTFGSQTFETGTITVPSKGFSGWMEQTFTFTASGTSQTLSFLAVGTPSGEPPFSLLGGIELDVIPEATNWMVFMGFGVACTVVEVMRRRRRHSQTEPID